MTRAEAFEALGLPAGSDASDVWQEAVELAWRKFRSKHHPDKGGDKEAFQRVKAAYEFLTGKAGPDNAKAQMLERVSGLFAAAVEACDDPMRYDIIERVKDSLKHVKRELSLNIQNTRRAIVKREKILKRLHSRKPEEHFLHDLLEKDIIRHKRSMEELEGEIPKVDEVLKFLDGYVYETTEAPQMPTTFLGHLPYLGKLE